MVMLRDEDTFFRNIKEAPRKAEMKKQMRKLFVELCVPAYTGETTGQ
jgi:hypothetical protein